MKKSECNKIRNLAKELEPIYQLFNWPWVGGSGAMGLPTAKNIEHCIFKLLKEIEKDKLTWEVYSGGICIKRILPNQIEISWQLKKSIYIGGD